jgi:hypothetical protein
MINKIKDFVAKLDLKILLIIGLIIALLLTRMCSGGDQTTPPTVKVDGKKYELLKHTIDTVYIPKDTIVYRPGKVIYKDPPIQILPPTKIDTSAVIKEYYSKIVYRDTLNLNEGGGTITVTDTVSQNKIIGRLWKASIKQKVIHDVTIVKDLPKTQIYIGGAAGFDKVNIVNFVGPSILLKTKQDHIYSLGVGYNNNKTVSIQGGIYWKIKLRK